MPSPQVALMIVAIALGLAAQSCVGTATANTSAGALSGPAPAPVLAQAPVPAAASPPAASEVRRELLVRRDLPELPGWETRLYLIEFPPGTRSPVHEHVVTGVGYVLDGSFESAFGEGPATVTRAGQAFVDFPHEPHHFRNADAARPLRFVVAGTFRKDDPLFRALPH